MNVVLVTKTCTLAMDPDTILSVDQSSGHALALDPDMVSPPDALVILRSTLRGVVLLMRNGEATLTVNGRRVTGFSAIGSNAAVRLQMGTRVHSFAIVFDDAATDVPAGAVCDICGRQLVEAGKGHCRRSFCVDCIETFSGKCPDCGKELVQKDTAEDTPYQFREFLPEAGT